MKVRAGSMSHVLNKHNARTTKAVRDAMSASDEHATEPRPRTRGECVDGPRPCPWVGCRHHLAIDINTSGHPRIAFGIDDDGDVRLAGPTGDSCSLDVADAGSLTLDDLGAVLAVTRERARQIEGPAVELLKGKLRRLVRREQLDERDLVHAFGPSRGPF